MSRQQVDKWLSKELSYTLHKPVRKRFPQNKTIVFYINELRISHDKGYVQSWSEEHFVVDSRLRRTPNVYVLRYVCGETLQGVLYKEELQRVIAPDVLPISRIIQTLELVYSEPFQHSLGSHTLHNSVEVLGNMGHIL